LVIEFLSFPGIESEISQLAPNHQADIHRPQTHRSNKLSNQKDKYFR